MELTKENIEQWKLLYDAEYKRRTGIVENIGQLISDTDLLGMYKGTTPDDSVVDDLSYD